MPVPTDQEILDALRTAFFEIASGSASSYTVNGKTWTALNLKDLEAAIDAYETRVNRRTRRIFGVGVFREPRS